MLYINPNECIDCEACVPECPVSAIFREDQVPAEYEQDIEINAQQSLVLPNIIQRKTPLADECP